MFATTFKNMVKGLTEVVINQPGRETNKGSQVILEVLSMSSTAKIKKIKIAE